MAACDGRQSRLLALSRVPGSAASLRTDETSGLHNTPVNPEQAMKDLAPAVLALHGAVIRPIDEATKAQASFLTLHGRHWVLSC